MSTENRLAEIREREKAACPGPWLVSWCQVPKYPDGRDVYFFGIRDNHGTLADPDEHGFVDPDGSGTDDNWIFLQHARDDIPYLLAEVERLTAERDAMKAHLANTESWEAALIIEPECWRGATPTVTQELWDRWIDLQTARNVLLHGKEATDGK